MTKPLIGVTGGKVNDNACQAHYGVLTVYVEAIVRLGGIPLVIAPGLDCNDLRELYEYLDGVLLTGGGDVEPRHYGMTEDGLVHGTDSERDIMESCIARWSAAEDKPLLGICRGSQIANVALGGTLYRDLSIEYGEDGLLEHDYSKRHPRDYEAHSVDVKQGSKLAAIVGLPTLRVNSLHHQAIRDVAPALSVAVRASDGVIEGVEHSKAHFFVGVQWHPEEMIGYSEPMKRLLGAFISAATS